MFDVFSRFDEGAEAAQDLYRRGIVSLSESGGHLGGDVTEQIARRTDDLVTRAIVAADVPSGPPTVLPPADDVIRVSTVGDECRVDAPDSIPSGSAIRLDFANDADVIRIVTMTSCDQPGAAMPGTENFQFALFAQPGAGNAGVILPWTEGPWTIACLDADQDVLGSPTRLLIADP